MATKFSIPLHVAVLEVLRRRGQLREDELYEELRKIYGDTVSRRELLKTLMSLELEGLIQVRSSEKGRLITLLR